MKGVEKNIYTHDSKVSQVEGRMLRDQAFLLFFSGVCAVLSHPKMGEGIPHAPRNTGPDQCIYLGHQNTREPKGYQTTTDSKD